MKKITPFFISTFYGISGLFFLLSAARDVYTFSMVMEWGMFIILCIGIALSLHIKASWIAYYQYTLVLFYNPLILSQIYISNTFIADIIIGLTFFFIGLHWKKSI